MFNFILCLCVENFHIMNINVPASVGAPPLHTQLSLNNFFSSVVQLVYIDYYSIYCI